MADIGEEVGIAASAIYWHFPSKQDLLVSVFDQCLDRLLSDQANALDRLGETRSALLEVLRLHVDFVVDERGFAQVYYREAMNLPDMDLRRLRQKQRAYVDQWTKLLRALRPELDQERAETLVHAAIGTVQSALLYRTPLATNDLKNVLTVTAKGVLSARVS